MKITKNIVQFRNGIVNLPQGKTVNHLLAMSVTSELMQFGYLLDQDAITNVSNASETDITNFHNEVITWLKEMTGSNRTYKPFWKGFPQEVMSKSEGELWLHQIVHYLTGGAYEPSEWTKERPTAFEHPKYTRVKAGTEDDFLGIFTKMVSLNQSLTPDDLEVVKFFVDGGYELRMPTVIPFKETLTVLGGMYLSVPVKTVTDVLRIAVHLSGGDTSLPSVPSPKIRANAWSRSTIDNPAREKFKFKKFNRGERKYILGLLEQTNCDVREFVLKDSRWIRLGEILHPGEYTKQFPKAAEMFDDIRNTKVQSWYGEVDAAFKKDFKIGLKKLSERPGEFMRRLDSLLRMAGTAKAYDKSLVKEITASLDKMGLTASNKVLFESYMHFEKRDQPVQNRTVMIKGARKKTRLPDLPALSSSLVEEIQISILASLQLKFASLEKMGKVYLDEELLKLPLPTNMRSMSSTLKPVMRGQRVPMGNQNAKVIRAFVHWFDERGDQDLDLTATFFGQGKVKHIGWNGDKNTTEGCYSGDIRHRKGACAEYIDINVKAARENGYQYVVLDTRNYNGGSLESVKDCVFGYMEREHPKANEIFVPATLANTVRLTSQSANSISAVIDLETQEYIFLDIDQDGIPVASANFDQIMEAIKPYTELPRFSVYHLLLMHTEARKAELVETPEEAETVLTIDSFPSYLEIGQWMGV